MTVFVLIHRWSRLKLLAKVCLPLFPVGLIFSFLFSLSTYLVSDYILAEVSTKLPNMDFAVRYVNISMPTTTTIITVLLIKDALL